jgi:hypothetical protein
MVIIKKRVEKYANHLVVCEVIRAGQNEIILRLLFFRYLLKYVDPVLLMILGHFDQNGFNCVGNILLFIHTSLKNLKNLVVLE